MSNAWSPRGLECGAVIYGDGGVSNLSFHREGKYLLMTTKDSAVHLIDAHDGTEKKKLHTRKNQIGSAVYTHHEACVLLSSDSEQGQNNDINYLCMHDNRYLRHFKGHTDKVTSLAMNPTEDKFISSSNDGSVMLWSINCPTPIAKLKLPGNIQNPKVCIDGTGCVFGVQVQDSRTELHSIKLFDVRAYEKESFQDAVPDYPVLQSAVQKGMVAAGIEAPSKGDIKSVLDTVWDGFSFAPNGKSILVNTCSDLILLLEDSPECNVEPLAICSRKNDTGNALGACYSADSKHVICGDEDGEVQVYELNWTDSKKSATFVNSLTGHVDPVSKVAANPVYDVIASGCVNTALWVRNSTSMDTE